MPSSGSAQPRWAESQGLLSVSDDSGSADAHSAPLAPARGHPSSTAVAVGLFALAAVSGLAASSGVRSQFAGPASTKEALWDSHKFAPDDSALGGVKRSKSKALGVITAHNEYTDVRGFAGKGYAHLEQGMVVEPHRLTTLQYVLPKGLQIGEPDDDNKDPMWSVQWTPGGAYPEACEITEQGTNFEKRDDGTTLVTAVFTFTELGACWRLHAPPPSHVQLLRPLPPLTTHNSPPTIIPPSHHPTYT